MTWRAFVIFLYLVHSQEKILKSDGTLIRQADDEGSLGSAEDASNALPATLLDGSIDPGETDDVQYKFIDEENGELHLVTYKYNLCYV